jgi:hypothetical protein
MKRLGFLLAFLPVIFILLFTSESRASRDQMVTYYGGRIQVNNTSSYNVYIIFQTVDNTKRRLCAEKDEEVQITHTLYYDKNLANPANYYTNISFYDFDSGGLLKTSAVNAGTFQLKSGSINANNAVFELAINDVFLEAGL